MDEVKRQTKRLGVAIVGGAVVIVGIIAIPYPGPGWLIVFAGLAILATEFAWARRVLDVAKGKYELWEKWLKRQPSYVRGLVLVLMGVVIMLTLWLLGMFGLFDHWLGLHWTWLHSPLGIFK